MRKTTPPPTRARQLGTDAFVFGFPLLLMATTMRGAISASTNGGGEKLNCFAHLRRFPDPGVKTIAAANADTLYSLTWLDLGAEPILLEIPDTGGRNYLMPLLDAWTNVFTSIAPHTAGGDGGSSLAIVGPGWRGELPEGFRGIDAPTDHAWGIFHLHANGRDDLEASRQVQDQLLLTPMSAYGNGGSSVPSEPTMDPLPAAHRRVMEMDADRFLGELAAQMTANPPAAVDRPILDRLAEIGLRPGEPFDRSLLSEATHEELKAGLEEGKELVSSAPGSDAEKGWQVLHTGADSYGTDYLRRARIANFALGINRPEDALFPLSTTDSDGHQLTGAHRYVLSFRPAGMPPVNGIWSLAIYDMDQLFVANPIDRYALGSRDELELGADGSLEIAIQHESPNGAHPTWLPAPEGDFYLMLHLYAPGEKALNGEWTVPPILRVG